MSETKQSVFATLSAINVREKIERKGNLDYLSWANAWAMLKAIYPDAQRKVYEHDHTGFNYFTDGKYAWVKVGVTIGGQEHVVLTRLRALRRSGSSSTVSTRCLHQSRKKSLI